MTVKQSERESFVKKIPRFVDMTVKESVCESIVRRFLDLLI